MKNLQWNGLQEMREISWCQNVVLSTVRKIYIKLCRSHTSYILQGEAYLAASVIFVSIVVEVCQTELSKPQLQKTCVCSVTASCFSVHGQRCIHFHMQYVAKSLASASPKLDPFFLSWTHLQMSKYLTVQRHQWPLLLTWFNFNPSMDKLSHAW